jgi:hypothetical protein
MISSRSLFHIAAGCAGSSVALLVSYHRLRRDRWVTFRRHPWSTVRYVYQSLAIYQLAWRVDRTHSRLVPPVDAMAVMEGGDEILSAILASGPDTFQSKPSNRAQIHSLMDCVSDLVQHVRGTGVIPIVLDLGAGKALFTRAIYEALGRQVSAVAMDLRGPKVRDHFYDPPIHGDGAHDMCGADAPPGNDNDPRSFTRVVADVNHLSSDGWLPQDVDRQPASIVAITKHLCGGATDGSIRALCNPPLVELVGACCLAPCCHQKMLKSEYCNVAFLESQGFCQTHVGLRGNVEDSDFRTFGMLISMSKSDDLKKWEYKKSTLLKLLGIPRARQLGVKVRRILEEGRIEFLKANGFEAHLVRYCDDTVTFDNLAIIATRIPIRESL